MKTVHASGGMVTAPHHLAAEAGRDVLRDGGNAIEAAVAAAACIAVVYPHMNGLGGDGFWLIHAPGAPPMAIDAAGFAGARADAEFFSAQEFAHMPTRGPPAANTVAGAVGGWQDALALSAEWGGAMALARLLEPAMGYAEDGMPVAGGLAATAAAVADELRGIPGFAETYLAGGAAPSAGEVFRNPRLARTLHRLADAGLDDFYRGAVAADMARDLAAAGSPVTADDLARYRARRVTPLALSLDQGTVYNLPPPTQGLASLMILGIFQRLGVTEAEGFAHLHGLIEAFKHAYQVRDSVITDPAFMDRDPARYLEPGELDARAGRIDQGRAGPWSSGGDPGDTVWLGAVDSDGRVVSYIQSLYWEFGSGLVLPETGILWQNRGCSFGIGPHGRHPISPGRRPFHTLNPALAVLGDGRVMAYGAMGGDGQPQFQAAIFTRYAVFGGDLQEALSAPRWLLGRTWGMESSLLHMESRFDGALVTALGDAGHAIQMAAPYAPFMGHAGALVHHQDGLIEGASDPRCDGRAVGV